MFVAPAIAPVLDIPPLVAFKDLTTVSPSASTLNPVIVIVPIVKSPLPSIFVAPEIALALVIPVSVILNVPVVKLACIVP